MVHIPKRYFFVLPFLLIVVALLALPAAASPLQTIKAIPQTPIVVPAGSTTDDVIAVGQDADISGMVTDTVLVINGKVHLASRADVGLVVNIGGQVIRDPGARVTEMFSLSFSKPLLNSFAVGAALALGLEAARLSFSIVMILLPVIFTLLMGERLQKPMAYLEQSVRRVGVVGLLTFFGCMAAALILGVTVIGLPISGLLVLIYVCTGVIGMSTLSVWIGKSVFGAVINEKNAWVQSFAGALLMTASFNIPAIGPLLFILLWIVGTGCVAAWLWQSRRFRKRGN